MPLRNAKLLRLILGYKKVIYSDFDLECNDLEGDIVYCDFFNVCF